MKKIFPFAVGWIVTACLFTWSGLSDSLTWYSIHLSAKDLFSWLVFAVYAPLWVMLVDFVGRKKECSTLSKILLYIVGAIVFWIPIFGWELFKGNLTSEQYYMIPIVIVVSLICSFVFWGLVTWMSKHRRIWGVIGVFALIFSILAAFVPMTSMKDVEIKDATGMKEVSFSLLTGELEVPLKSKGNEDYFILILDQGFIYGPGMYSFASKNDYTSNDMESTHGPGGEDIYKIKGPNPEVTITIIGKGSKNGNIKIFHGTDMEQVINDYHKAKGI